MLIHNDQILSRSMVRVSDFFKVTVSDFGD